MVVWMKEYIKTYKYSVYVRVRIRVRVRVHVHMRMSVHVCARVRVSGYICVYTKSKHLSTRNV